MLDVTLLGTGALVPLAHRALTAAFLACGGHSILFDCGEGTQSAAGKAGVSLIKTDLIALTHYHGDHLFGLPGLLQTLSCMGRTEPLCITGPEGLEKELAPVLALAGWTSYAIRLIEMPREGLDLGARDGWPERVKLSAFRTAHRVPSQGYCFEMGRAGKFMPEKARALAVPTQQWGLLQKGQSVRAGDQTVLPEQVLGEPRKGLKFVFSGDTAPCEALTNAARDADLMICEATYGEMEQAELAAEHGHMTFAQAAQTAASAEAKRLWLAHYSPRIEDPSAFLPNAKAVFDGAVCGEDGMSITLRFDP